MARVKTYRAPTKVCRTCGKRTSRYYLNAKGRPLSPHCKPCFTARQTANKKATRSAITEIRERHRTAHHTLRVVNPSLTVYRERWVYAWGWVKLCEWPV